MSILFRQTNIIWIGFVALASLIRKYEVGHSKKDTHKKVDNGPTFIGIAGERGGGEGREEIGRDMVGRRVEREESEERSGEMGEYQRCMYLRLIFITQVSLLLCSRIYFQFCDHMHHIQSTYPSPSPPPLIRINLLFSYFKTYLLVTLF